jgi:hypothetical protein
MKPCTLIASFLFSAAVINSASAACFCEEPLGVNYLAINSSDIQEKAFHIMKNVYHNATDLFRKIDVRAIIEIDNLNFEQLGKAIFFADAPCQLHLPVI